MRRILLTALPALAALAVPATSVAAGPQPPDCPLLAPRPAVEKKVDVGGGASVTVRNPYGSLLFRNRLFFSFSAKPSPAARDRIADVTWALDGVVARTDTTAPYTWAHVSGSSHMPAGDHVITVTVHRRDGGTAATTSFALTATDCAPVESFAEIGLFGSGGRASHGASLYATSSFESSTGPTMTSVQFLSTGVRVHLPASARGRTVGKLLVGRGNAIDRHPPVTRSYALRLPRRGPVLRASLPRVVLHPGSDAYLSVIGLPSGTREIRVLLTGAGRRLLTTRHIARDECRYTSAVRVSSARSAVRVTEGTTTGRCND